MTINKKNNAPVTIGSTGGAIRASIAKQDALDKQNHARSEAHHDRIDKSQPAAMGGRGGRK